jgi:hypothetical protein
MAHPVINANWLRRHLPNNQPAGAAAWGGVTPPTAAQMAARLINPDYVPPIDQIFPATINPHTGISFVTVPTIVATWFDVYFVHRFPAQLLTIL